MPVRRDLLQKLSEDFPVAEEDLREKPELANLLDFPVDSYVTARSLYNLDAPPTDTVGALARYIYLEPTPSEVFGFLPSDVVYSDILPRDANYQLQEPPTARLLGPERVALAKSLDARYPKVPGRAGAKTNLAPSDILMSETNDPVIHLMAVRLDGVPNDWEATFAAALLALSLASVPARDMSIWLCNQSWFFSLDFLDAAKVLKQIHTAIRTTRMAPWGQFLSADEARCLYGLDALPGRNEKFKFDATAEIMMRIADPSIRAYIGRDGSLDYTNYDLDLYQSIDEAVTSVLPGRVHLESFSHWYDRRMFWAAAGGAPGATVRWATDGDRQRLNKRGALLLIPEIHMLNILKNVLDPVLYSKAAVKFENGKNRAIWNTAIEHYVIQAYILDMFEGANESGTWNAGAASADEMLRGTVRRLLNLGDRVGLMWDFSDFNINHTLTAQTYLWQAVERALLKRGSGTTSIDTLVCAQDIRMATAFIVGARNFTVLHDTETDFIARVSRSLQSGERATSFTNTFLNRAYTLQVRRYFVRSCGRPIIHDESYHQGDDVYLTVDNVCDAQEVCYAYNLLGYAGQVHKIMADYPNSRGEFLRIHYDYQLKRAVGYPVRSYMGLIGGEFFREGLADPGARSISFSDQVAKVNRRGGRISKRLLERLQVKNTSLSYTSEDKKSHKVTVPPDLLTTPVRFGGYASTLSAEAISLAHDTSALSFLNDRDLTTAVLSVSVPLAIGIPSGEGKSTLARKYPHLFADPDDYVDFNYVMPFVEREAWDELSQIHRATHFPRNKILLMWNYHTCPNDFQFLGSFLVDDKHATGVRLNAGNRAAIMQEADDPRLPKPIIAESFDHRDQAIFDVLQRFIMEKTVPTPNTLRARDYRTYTSAEPQPVYEPPQVPLSVFFSHPSARRLPDFSFAARLGLANAVPRLQRSILDSAITGAYDPRDLSTSYARFAERLDAYLQQVTKGPIRIGRYVPQALVSKFRDFACSHYSRLVNSGDPLAPHTRHSYGSLHALVPELGLNSFSTLTTLIDEMPPSLYLGRAGKLRALIMASHDVGPVARSMLAFIDRYLTCDLSDVDHSNFLFDWLVGGMAFLSAPPSAASPLALSTNRSIVLSFLEHYSNQLYYPDSDLTLDIVSALETLGLHCYMAYVQVGYPNFDKLPLDIRE